VELAASVATNSHERPRRRVRHRLRSPDFPQNDIDQGGARMHQPFDGLFGEETSLQLLVSVAQQLAISGGRALRFSEENG
jgi:hypothetical protein